MMGEKRKTCMDCRYRLSDDFGYSNYTVEGTTFYCLLKKHPDMPFDEFYGEDKRLKYAEQCGSFVAGEGVYLDCDREDLKSYDDKLSTAYTKDPEIAALLDEWEAAPPQPRPIA